MSGQGVAADESLSPRQIIHQGRLTVSQSQSPVSDKMGSRRCSEEDPDISAGFEVVANVGA